MNETDPILDADMGVRGVLLTWTDEYALWVKLVARCSKRPIRELRRVKTRQASRKNARSSFDIHESWSRGCTCYQLLCISHYHSGRERGLVVHNERQSVEEGKEEEDAISSNLGSHPSSSIFCSFAALPMTQLTHTRSYSLLVLDHPQSSGQRLM